MLTAYGAANGCLTEFEASATPGVPPDTVWLDLVEPTAAEEAAVEAALGIDIPTREELAEIEASLVRQSRIYSVALTVVLLVFCGLPWVSEPLSHIAMCFSLGAYCGAILFRVRFRLAQVRSRELFSLWTWLRRFWGASS